MKTTLVKAALISACCILAVVPRAEANEFDRIAFSLAIKKGTVVADVGAGHGEWSVDLARRIGETGRVYSTEIDLQKLANIRKAASRAGLENVTVVEGAITETKLPEQCCDAILLRKVYHHFTNPHEMDRSMYTSLRPGGVILVIDFEPGAPGAPTHRLPGVPERRGGHGTPQEQVIEEMTANGFELVRRIENWSYSDYAMLFRRPE